ncbi:MAG: Mth938-like domain-containing protein [Betaproteobacteria bacterium]
MKLHPSQASSRNTFTGYGSGYVSVNGVRYETNLVVMPERILEHWPVGDIQAMATADVTGLIALKPELVLLGTGKTLRFPHAAVLGALAAAGIGMEVMDTQAACRTYNILSEEGRNVAAALIIRTN